MTKTAIKNKIVKYDQVSWKELIPVQNDKLEEYIPGGYTKIKNAFLRHSFFKVIHVYENKGKLYLLEGVKFFEVLKDLHDEGVKVPEKLSAVWVDCKDMQEAAELVLVYLSHFTETNKEALREHLKIYQLDDRLELLDQELQLVGLDVGLIELKDDLDIKNTFDQIEGAKNSSIDSIKYKGYRINLTEEEAEFFEKKIKVYLEDNGTLYGFVKSEMMQ